MLSLVIRPLRNIAAVLVANESPRQIAIGIALGVVIGLVPKGNLLAIALMVLLCSLRVNRTAGLLTACVFSWISVMADSFTHKLGAKILATESLQPVYAWVYELPLGPWIGINNTVVVGSLAMGLYVAYPSYLLAKLLLDRYHAPIAAWIRRTRIARWLLGADVTSRFGLSGNFSGVGSLSSV